MSARGGPAQCFRCQLWLLTPDEWDRHFRVCWKSNSLDELEKKLTSSGRILGVKKRARLSPVKDSLFELLRHNVWMSAQQSGKLAHVLQHYDLYETTDLRYMKDAEFQRLLGEFKAHVLRNRLIAVKRAVENN